MEAYNVVMKKLSNHELILGGLLAVYSVFDVQAPQWLNEFIVSDFGSIVLILFTLSLFLYVNPIIAILGLVAAYELIKRSRMDTHHGDSMISYLPKTQPGCSDLNAYNQFSTTLEQEMVQKMAPLVGPSVGAVSYKPHMDSDHDASPIDA
jgi:hypothetical protein